MKKSIFLPLLFVSILSSQVLAISKCGDMVEKTLKPQPRDGGGMSTDSAGKTIGKTLTEKQKEILKPMLSSSQNETYTASEVAAQNKLLEKAGFTEDEIATLRRENVISNSTVKFAAGSPTGMEVVHAELTDLNSAALKNLKDGQSVTYVIGENGHMYISPKPIALPPDKLIVISSRSATSDSSLPDLVVRESGELVFNKSNRSFTFRPKSGVVSNQQEVARVMSDVSATNPGSGIKYKPAPGVPQSRLVKCLDILSAQSNGKNFVLDKLISENALTTTAIIISEAGGAKRFTTDEGRRVIGADMIGTNVNGVIGGVISKNLVLQNTSFTTSMATRVGIGLSMIELQKQITKGMLDDQHQGTAEEIANFNRMHFFARVPINHAIDQFMVNSLPEIVFSACQKNPGITALISPTAVRLYERATSATLYYGLRSAIIGQ